MPKFKYRAKSGDIRYGSAKSRGKMMEKHWVVPNTVEPVDAIPVPEAILAAVTPTPEERQDRETMRAIEAQEDNMTLGQMRRVLALLIKRELRRIGDNERTQESTR